MDVITAVEKSNHFPLRLIHHLLVFLLPILPPSISTLRCPISIMLEKKKSFICQRKNIFFFIDNSRPVSPFFFLPGMKMTFLLLSHFIFFIIFLLYHLIMFFCFFFHSKTLSVSYFSSFLFAHSLFLSLFSLYSSYSFP